MSLPPIRKRSLSNQGFTLLELLVVLAILAVIATGVAGVYGRKNIDEAKDKMTLHEMREIKKAFLQFESDNFRRLREYFSDHTGVELPTTDFANQFSTPHLVGASPEQLVADEKLKGLMEFYETYGLWFLLQPQIADSGLSEARLDSDDEYRFPVFRDFEAITCEGWNGPYLDAEIREAWVYDDISFPQVADKHGGVTVNETDLLKPLGVYRLLYYEHREVIDTNRDVIYRRLLLIAPRGNVDRDELTSDELLLETGNLRGGTDEGRLDLDTRAFSNSENSPFFTLELLNMDLLPE